MYKFVIKDISGTIKALSVNEYPTVDIAQSIGNKVKNKVDKFKYCTIDVIPTGLYTLKDDNHLEDVIDASIDTSSIIAHTKSHFGV